MPRFENACPFEAAVRAARCQNCNASNNNLPPCVAVYLGSRDSARPANVVPLREKRPAVRKAA